MKHRYVKQTDKYDRAVAWMLSHPDLIKAHPRWRQMLKESLYLLLMGIGVRWDRNLRDWTESTTPSDKRQPAPQVSLVKADNIISVRIMTSNDRLDRAADNLAELADLCGWRLESRSAKTAWGLTGLFFVFLKFVDTEEH